MMDQLIAKFPEQLAEALEIGKAAIIRPHSSAIHKAYVAGLGGSGIGGNFVAEFIRDECGIPYNVGKGYQIPHYIDKNTLVIVSSYSGNTEETLISFEALKVTGAKIVVISSGGKLIAAAKDLELDYIQVPGNWPSPRACLGYSLTQQLFVLNKLGLIGTGTIDQIEEVRQLLIRESDDIKEQAERLAQLLMGKTPIIYTTDRMEAVAVRFRQQINENSKMLCWHHVIPEMNHNELVGWRDVNDKLAVVYFRNEDDYKRNQVRIDINKDIISNYTSSINEIYSKGNSLVEKSLYLVHLGDWASFYLAQLRGMDSLEVDVIDFLKSELNKI